MRIGEIKKIGVREIETPDWENNPSSPPPEPVKREPKQKPESVPAE